MKKLAIIVVILASSLAHAQSNVALKGFGLRLQPIPAAPANFSANRVGMWSPSTGPNANKPLWRNADGTDSLMAAGSAGYALTADEGTSLTARTILNFIGTGVTCVDNAGATRTDCTFTSGSGDMVLASAQTNTGVKTFNDGTFRQLNSGATFYSQLASAATGNRTATIPDATGTLAMLGLAQQFTADQGSQSFTLTDAANISTTWSGTSKGNTATVTLAGNRTLDNPTGMLDGHTYQWVVKQDGAGSRTLAYGTKFAWPSGTPPTLTTAAAAYDVISCVYLSGPDLFFCNAMNDVKH